MPSQTLKIYRLRRTTNFLTSLVIGYSIMHTVTAQLDQFTHLGVQLYLIYACAGAWENPSPPDRN